MLSIAAGTASGMKPYNTMLEMKTLGVMETCKDYYTFSEIYGGFGRFSCTFGDISYS